MKKTKSKFTKTDTLDGRFVGFNYHTAGYGAGFAPGGGNDLSGWGRGHTEEFVEVGCSDVKVDYFYAGLFVFGFFAALLLIILGIYLW